GLSRRAGAGEAGGPEWREWRRRLAVRAAEGVAGAQGLRLLLLGAEDGGVASGPDLRDGSGPGGSGRCGAEGDRAPAGRALRAGDEGLRRGARTSPVRGGGRRGGEQDDPADSGGSGDEARLRLP